METIEAGDASQNMIVVGTYIRIKRANGKYSCQLALGKSKLVPKGLTIPRAELVAARLNSQVGHIVHRPLGDRHVKRYRVTDSEITLHWLNSWEKPLKQFVRGIVVDTLRFSQLEEWGWIPSEDNPCDLGTRRNVEISDVGPGSPWELGKDWMRESEDKFPIKSIESIKLS